MLQISSGRVDRLSPNNTAKVVRAIRAGRPNNSSDNASPVIYVRDDTGAATKTS